MQLVLWPAVITLGITLLRLFGELQGWAPAFFNRAAGGGGALVGISWLPFVLGPYFAVKLAKGGRGPARPWKAAGLALLGLLIAMGGFGVAQGLKLGVGAVLGAFLLSLAVAFLPYGTWPELGRTLFGYALAARVPVVIVMLFAIYGKWGTHYDVLPPDPPPALRGHGSARSVVLHRLSSPADPLDRVHRALGHLGWRCCRRHHEAQSLGLMTSGRPARES